LRGIDVAKQGAGHVDRGGGNGAPVAGEPEVVEGGGSISGQEEVEPDEEVGLGDLAAAAAAARRSAADRSRLR
jgi:hypothetical protein